MARPIINNQMLLVAVMIVTALLTAASRPRAAGSGVGIGIGSRGAVGWLPTAPSWLAQSEALDRRQDRHEQGYAQAQAGDKKVGVGQHIDHQLRPLKQGVGVDGE